MSEDDEFLLSLVEDIDSDYHDGLGGYPNYHIRDGILAVTFQDAETDEFISGEWQLTKIESD